jgi:hypothetical protein
MLQKEINKAIEDFVRVMEKTGTPYSLVVEYQKKIESISSTKGFAKEAISQLASDVKA